MDAIFVSHRREDSEGHAGRLVEDLTGRFGRHAVFFDVDTIAPGEDFRRAIDDDVARCSVLPAVIGPRRLEAANDAAPRHPGAAGAGARRETSAARRAPRSRASAHGWPRGRPRSARRCWS